ncbi:MAG: GLPGLI family protein [Ginsengibacter sp.]
MRRILIFSILIISNIGYLIGQPTVDNLKNDSTKMFVQYAHYRDYQSDSAYSRLIYGSLFLGKRGAVYTYQLQSVEEMLRAKERSVKNEKNKKFVLEETMKFRDWDRQLTEIITRYYDSPGHLSLKKFDKDFYWLADTIPFLWELVNEFKTIDNYRCQKAVINSDKLKIEAWFTEQIPIPAGPYNISGLPGLILEYYNSITKTFFKATLITSTNIPDEKFRNWLTGPLISREKYKKLMAENQKNFENLQKMIQRGNTGKSN